MARRCGGSEAAAAGLGIKVCHEENLETVPASLGAAVKRAAGAEDDAQQEGANVKHEEFKDV